MSKLKGILTVYCPCAAKDLDLDTFDDFSIEEDPFGHGDKATWQCCECDEFHSQFIRIRWEDA